MIALEGEFVFFVLGETYICIYLYSCSCRQISYINSVVSRLTIYIDSLYYPDRLKLDRSVEMTNFFFSKLIRL